MIHASFFVCKENQAIMTGLGGYMSCFGGTNDMILFTIVSLQYNSVCGSSNVVSASLGSKGHMDSRRNLRES